MTNFTNGALVFRLWNFDGAGELLAKFQYRSHAEAYADFMAADDRLKRPGEASKYCYVAVCENECSVRAFGNVDPKEIAP